MNKTRIEYLTHTWNPIAMRCTPVSDGCRNCWHLAMAKRLAKNPMIDRNMRDAYAGEIQILFEKELEAPLHLRKPSRIGVQFMGDLFHNDVDSEWIKDIFSIIRACQHHIFLILTKRPEKINKRYFEYFGRSSYPNLWLGISVEDQKTADERIPILLNIPAAHRWVSVEPMLGAVDLKLMGMGTLSHLRSFYGEAINLVIAGGETGLGARPIHPEWVRSLRDQCQPAGVPFFFKNWGEWLHESQFRHNNQRDKGLKSKRMEAGDGFQYIHVGHKYCGHLLDGKEYREIYE